MGLLALTHIGLNFLLMFVYRETQHIALLLLLVLLGLVCTSLYLILVYSIAPKKKILRYLVVGISLTPFLALPLIAYLWSLKAEESNPYFNRYKIILLFVGSLLALTYGIKPTDYLTKNELLLARVLPPEISWPFLSYLEGKRVSALSPYDVVTTPWAAYQIKHLRLKQHPDFSLTLGINPNNIFKILPLGFSWVRGAPIHAFSILLFHQLQR